MRVLKIFVLLLITLFLLLAVRQYFFCPKYVFAENKPFAGNLWYNPYQRIDSGNWIKCNFHAHTNAWGFLSNGKGSAADVWKAYDSLGYTVNSVSEYQKINKLYDDRPGYLSAYEHGYNLMKTHQLVLGADKVLWLDYFFPQTLSNKQYILRRLSDGDDQAIIANHPAMRKGYTVEEMKKLTGYRCMEILNPRSKAFAQWDAALSSGIPVFGVGDDDIHNVFNPAEYGRYCTVLNVPLVNKKNVLRSLREGNGFAMLIPMISGETHTQRQERIKNQLPSLRSFSVTNDSINIEISDQAQKIVFSGQDGKEQKTVIGLSKAIYNLRKEDTYIRTSIYFRDGTEMYLNPVFRYANTAFDNKTKFKTDTLMTILYTAGGLFILFFWGIFLFWQLFRKKKRPALQKP